MWRPGDEKGKSREHCRATWRPQQLCGSDFDHLEIVLGHAAVGTGPCVGNVLPARPRRDAFFRQAGFLIVDEAADHAHELAIGLDGCGACGHDSSLAGWVTSLFSQDAPPHESATSRTIQETLRVPPAAAPSR